MKRKDTFKNGDAELTHTCSCGHTDIYFFVRRQFTPRVDFTCVNCDIIISAWLSSYHGITVSRFWS